jgi:hypothetical protein
MSENYPKLISHAVVELPVEKQAEVYDFARFLKAAATIRVRKAARKKASILDLVGIGASKECDIALNHDKYLYD